MTKKNYTNWFQHDSNAMSNRNLKAMRSAYGNEGYGCWWILQEILSTQPGYRLDISGEYAINELADDMRMDVGYVERFINDCVNKFSLLVCDDTHLWSPVLIESLETLVEKRARQSEGGKKGSAITNAKKKTSKSNESDELVASNLAIFSTQNKTEQNNTEQNNTTENSITIVDDDVVVSSLGNTTNNSSFQGGARRAEDVHASVINNKHSLLDTPAAHTYPTTPGSMGTETMMQRALSDKEFTYITLQSFSMNEQHLLQWLEAFNRKLAFEADTIKNDKEYRRHFINWLKYRDVKHEDPTAYVPVSTQLPPGKVKTSVPLQPGKKTPQQLIAEREAKARALNEKWKNAG